jgi:uncharacterized membrane protein YeiB
VVRGAALLGILLMNVLIFGMSYRAYSNPHLPEAAQGSWAPRKARPRAGFGSIDWDVI